MFNVNKIAHHNPIYGPGKRTVIWFRGCSIHCKGCINPELWNKDDKCNMSLNALLDEIQDDGVTLLGGEPLEQEDLAELLNELNNRNVGIVLFTGYSIESYDDYKRNLVSKCDVVISEPYVDSLKDDSLYLRGSSNQIITFYSNRYDAIDFVKPNILEIEIQDTNVISYGRDKKLINSILDL